MSSLYEPLWLFGATLCSTMGVTKLTKVQTRGKNKKALSVQIVHCKLGGLKQEWLVIVRYYITVEPCTNLSTHRPSGPGSFFVLELNRLSNYLFLKNDN